MDGSNVEEIQEFMEESIRGQSADGSVHQQQYSNVLCIQISCTCSWHGMQFMPHIIDIDRNFWEA